MSKSSAEKLKTIASEIDTDTVQPIVRSNKNIYLAAVSSLMYIFAMGMTIGYPSQAIADMKRPGSRLQNITPDEVTWIGSLTLLGGIPANVLAGYFTHKFGRKAVLMLSSLLFLLSWLMIAYAPAVGWLCAGRVISGFCTGLYVVAVPAYISEIAPQEIRGFLSSGFPLANNFGMLVVNGLGMFVRWTWLAVSIAFVAALGACMMLFMPESPLWLVRESRIAEARKGLKFLKGKHPGWQKEVQDTIQNFSLKDDAGTLNYRDFLNPVLYKPIVISAVLMFFHQTAGAGAILTYTVEIFQNAGSSIPPTIAATILVGVQVVANVLSGVTIDKFGRRKLYIASGTGTSITLLALGSYSYFIKHHPDSTHLVGYIPLISLIGFAFAFNLGVGSIPFVMIPEMISIKYRSAVLSLSFLLLSVFGFVMVKIFEDLRTALGDSGLYWTYGTLTSLSIVYGYFFLPETKNKPIEEISEHFSKSGFRFKSLNT